jgi:diguanylate cyclase (GGDEF)-like protein
MFSPPSLPHPTMDRDANRPLPEGSSAIDSLTGIFNRRHLADRLAVEVASALRSGAQTAVLFLDVDSLKQLNDRFGHFAGDRALRAVAAQICRTLRLEDLVGRYGGNEFVILARESDANGAMRLAERLRGAIEGLQMVAEREDVRITISIGVAWLTELAPRDEHVFGLVALAVARMNEAKSSGGNRVCTTSTPSWPLHAP